MQIQCIAESVLTMGEYPGLQCIRESVLTMGGYPGPTNTMYTRKRTHYGWVPRSNECSHEVITDSIQQEPTPQYKVYEGQ